MLVGHSGAGDGAANVRRWSYRGSSGVCSEGNRQVQSDNREKNWSGGLGKQVVQYIADSAATCNNFAASTDATQRRRVGW